MSQRTLPSMEGGTDVDLWERVDRHGDADAFGSLFERYAQRVYAFCAHHTGDLAMAEDLTSVVFLEAWAGRGRVRLVDASVLPWLLGVATNVLRNARRSLRRQRAALSRLPSWFDTPDPADDVAARVDAQRRLAQARQALEALAVREREVVALVVWSGLSYEQTATALGIPVGTVRSRLSRAKARLRNSPASAPARDVLANTDGESG